MQATIKSRHKNANSDKFFVDDDNSLDNNKLLIDYNNTYDNDEFLHNYFGNSEIEIANVYNIKFLYISSSNSPPDFSIISQYNRVIYIANVARKARFTSLANIFVAQLCNFPSLKVDEFHYVQSIIYKPELQKPQSQLKNDEKVHYYIVNYIRDLVNKDILSLKKFIFF